MNPMIKEQKKLITGIVKRHADGFGFLIPDEIDHVDVYIPKNFMSGIMTNDRVLAEVFKARGEDRFHGQIIKVMTRGTKKLVGRVTRLNDHWLQLADESKGWGHDLQIRQADALSAKEGDLVQVEILTYPDEELTFTGKVIEVIGNAEDPLTDVKRVLRTQNVPEEFSHKTLSEVAGLKEDPLPMDWKNRIDLTNKPLITIDGATAKDFDDAVFVESTEKGFHLIVAIADVSFYVKKGTSLDRDAYERGTSVYFPNFVVPMLPEILSNGLCSLKPNVPRLCLVADMYFDFQGVLLNSKFYEAVMKSHARVTYGEAQQIIDGTDIEKFLPVKNNILRCSDLAKVLMSRRFREGSLDLNLSQTELEIDASGNPIDVQKSERLFAHRLIEELMLAANVAVAQFLENKEKGALYRIHEDPSADAIKLLEVYLHNLGSKIRLNGDNLQKKLSKAIESFSNNAEGQIISILTLRSLSQAKYSSTNVGHFGLGFKTYTHFTSPIRRYPDLIVHRLLKHYVVSSINYPIPELNELTTSGIMLSATEQRAVKCERQFMSIKKARFIQRFIGKEFLGMISSIARFGAFVLLREFDIDGLVKLENLGDDRWNYDENNLRLVGDRTKTVFKLGQMIKVLVVSVDVELGQINFDLLPEDKVTRKKSKFSNEKMEASSFPKKGERSFKPAGKRTSRETLKKRVHSSDKSTPRFDKKNTESKKVDLSKTNKVNELKIENRDGLVKRIFTKKTLAQMLDERKGKEKVSDKKSFNPFTRFKKKTNAPVGDDLLEGSEGANNRNRKNSRKNSKKRRKT